MDPLDAANRFLKAMGTPAAMGIVAPSAAEFLLRAKAPDEVLDIIMKRNLVFASWRAGTETGTWALSFDREGRLISAMDV